MKSKFQWHLTYQTSNHPLIQDKTLIKTISTDISKNLILIISWLILFRMILYCLKADLNLEILEKLFSWNDLNMNLSSRLTIIQITLLNGSFSKWQTQEDFDNTNSTSQTLWSQIAVLMTVWNRWYIQRKMLTNGKWDGWGQVRTLLIIKARRDWIRSELLHSKINLPVIPIHYHLKCNSNMIMMKYILHIAIPTHIQIANVTSIKSVHMLIKTEWGKLYSVKQ